MGEAIREFRKAASGVAEEEVRGVEKREEIDQKIIEMARSLGVSTEGKTKEQILDEINRKLAELKKS
jgi:sec-independent protein translocase protein TatA